MAKREGPTRKLKAAIKLGVPIITERTLLKMCNIDPDEWYKEHPPKVRSDNESAT